MSKILLLLDYKNEFLISIENLHDYKSMRVNNVVSNLEGYGHSVEVLNYSDFDFKKDYKNYFVLYQSAEDIGVVYKSYIEDIAYYLEMSGAKLLPCFTYFLAHHNKNFMEVLRSKFADKKLQTIQSQLFGTAEEAIKVIDQFPVVIKAAEGSGSSNVLLARNKKEFEKSVKKLSGVFFVHDLETLKDYVVDRLAQNLIHKAQSKYRRYTFFRHKFIVQNFIGGLQGDYKVLYFGGKFYALYRKNRENDFRASGGGRLFEPEEANLPGLLDFASRVIREIDFPILGLDIGFDGKAYHLFEFQCLHIGPYALQASTYWFESRNNTWVKFEGKSNLEQEFCRSINEFIQKKEK